MTSITLRSLLSSLMRGSLAASLLLFAHSSTAAEPVPGGLSEMPLMPDFDQWFKEFQEQARTRLDPLPNPPPLPDPKFLPPWKMPDGEPVELGYGPMVCEDMHQYGVFAFPAQASKKFFIFKEVKSKLFYSGEIIPRRKITVFTMPVEKISVSVPKAEKTNAFASTFWIVKANIKAAQAVVAARRGIDFNSFTVGATNSALSYIKQPKEVRVLQTNFLGAGERRKLGVITVEKIDDKTSAMGCHFKPI